MDQDSIERIRQASFPLARKGYETREVDTFLSRLADWLESAGPEDESRSDAVRAELERVGRQTAQILTDAHDVAAAMREEAERYAAGMRSEADAYSERVRIESDTYAKERSDEADAYMARHRNDADAYADEVRGAADQHAQEVRAGADEQIEQIQGEANRHAEQVRAQAERDAAAARRVAESKAQALVEEGNRRRAGIEQVISDLESRRDTVIEEMQRLSSELTGTASSHRTEDFDATPPADASAEEASTEEASAEQESPEPQPAPDAPPR